MREAGSAGREAGGEGVFGVRSVSLSLSLARDGLPVVRSPN